METFRTEYLTCRSQDRLTIVDIGSTEMGACYRPLFLNPIWNYVGVDLSLGPNVNVVLTEPYNWRELATSSADVVICGQVFEHVEYFWITILEISRILKPNGLLCLIVPSGGPEHRFPVDCWRVYPDGLRAIAEFGRLAVLKAQTDWLASGDPGSDFWRDSVLVAQKPSRGWLQTWRIRILQALQRRVSTLR